MEYLSKLKKCFFSLIRLAIIRLNARIHLTGINYIFGHRVVIRADRKSSITIGSRCNFEGYVSIGAYDGGEITIGTNTYINENVKIISLKKITIGNDVLIGPNVIIYDHNHRYNIDGKQINQSGYKKNSISIGNNVWICGSVVICSGVEISDNIVVAAGSVVIMSLYEKGIYAGNPAKLVSSFEK